MTEIGSIPQKSSPLWVKFDFFTLWKTATFASFAGHLVVKLFVKETIFLVFVLLLVKIDLYVVFVQNFFLKR